jgi:CRISPR-associated protein Cas4
MEEPILISTINDFIFCPVSIYFHNLYGDLKREIFQSDKQLNGTYVHGSIDHNHYSTKKNILQGIDVYCEKYNLIGKIDVFDIASGVLTERKRKIVTIYDGYVYQIYAQYFALCEMGYSVNKLIIHSFDDNKNYNIPLPQDSLEMLGKFEKTITKMNTFCMDDYHPSSLQKCKNCIYSDLCDRSLN